MADVSPPNFSDSSLEFHLFLSFCHFCHHFCHSVIRVLNFTDSLFSCFCTFSSNFNSEVIAWISSLQTLLTNLSFHIAKHFVYKPFNFKLGEMK